MIILPVGLTPAEPAGGRASVVRLRLWDSTGTRRLVPSRSHLTVAVEGGAFAEPSAIVDAVRRRYGLRVALLRVAAAGRVECEWLDSDRPAPSGFAWRQRPTAREVQGWPAWERPGWLGQTMGVVDDALARVGRRRVGPPTQARHTSVTALLRIATRTRPVWLKAMPALFAHEPAVIRALTSFGTVKVPRVLAVGDGWWLAAEFAAPARSPIGDPLVSLARTQIAAATRVDELRRLGCPARPLAGLAAALSRIAERRDLLAPRERRELARALPRFERVCTGLDALGFPSTLVHGDVSPGNVRWTRTGWLVYDWTDACITHPFVELASPLSYESDRAVIGARANAYAGPWTRVMPRTAVARALQAAGAVGAGHQAVSYETIVDAIDRTAADQASGRRLVPFVGYWVRRLLRSLDG